MACFWSQNVAALGLHLGSHGQSSSCGLTHVPSSKGETQKQLVYKQDWTRLTSKVAQHEWMLPTPTHPPTLMIKPDYFL